MPDSPQIIAQTYEIQKEIGSGGGGVVYLAQHLRLEKPVVLKADKRSISTDIEKLRREADALKSLSHSYIPQVYDFVSDGDEVYTVMDYMQGESFDKPLKRGEKFAQPQVIKWLIQLLEAVTYLHSRPPYGILHSDIKPANVMLLPSGDICLIDFNIALALGEEGSVAVGASRGYASPEHYGPQSLEEATGRKITTDNDETEAMTGLGSTIFTGGDGSSVISRKAMLLDARSDIYSIGATIYHILSGNRPSYKAREVVPLSGKSFSRAVIDIISKAMNPDPALRYQTAADMLNAVKSLHKNDLRYKRYIKSRYIAAAILSAMFLTSGFSLFAGLKRMEQAQASLALAEYSVNALERGDTALAIDYAVKALPETKNIFVPPPAAEAQKALTAALGVYDLADGYKLSGILNLPSAPFKIAVAPDGKQAAAVYAYSVVIFDTTTAEITANLPSAKSALADIEFVNNTTLAYAGVNGICVYDTASQSQLWQGRPATELSVSADKKIVAAVNKDANEAVIYSVDGKEKAVISFGGKKQKILADDSFANPNDNLFALNKDGTLLAVSFSNGALSLFDINSGEEIEVQPASPAIHFEGGFSSDYFAFSAIGTEGKSVFMAVDTQKMELTGSFEADNRFGVITDESGIYISADNLIVRINPVTGEQKEAAYTEKDVVNYSRSENNFIVSTKDGRVTLFDSNANPITKHSMEYDADFVDIGGSFAIIASRSSPDIRIMQSKDYSAADVFEYDPAYLHDEARLNSKGNRVMLFSYKGFRLYDIGGNVVKEASLPDAQMIYDQQYSSASGNLAVIYKNAVKIYSGENGELVFEKTGLQSVFYADYGISMFDMDGTVSLIDIDAAEIIKTAKANGSFAAICGITVTNEFLADNELIGASRMDDEYLFAVSNGANGTVYNGGGKKLFDFDVTGKAEAFFVADLIIISPQHGTPAAYNIKTGKKIRDLAPDSYMTYANAVGNYIASEYISSSGERFGVLLNANCKAVAQLTGLTDISGTQLFFDYKNGYIRKANVYSLEDLLQLAKE